MQAPKKNGANGRGDNTAQRVAQEFAASNGTSAKPNNPGDYWSPQGEEQEGEFKEILGPISPLPEHDGTECLKWDDSLWSHADHFRVRPLHTWLDPALTWFIFASGNMLASTIKQFKYAI